MAAASMAAVILAAGRSTRMRTERPKVLHEVGMRPMLAHVIDACRATGIQQCVIVVGFGKESVQAAFKGDDGLVWVEQPEQKGTGHAVQCCREQVLGRFENAFVLCGDGPLIRPSTLRALLERHQAERAAATLATAILDDPAGYGRIVRDAAGAFQGIVEDRDCTPEQRQIREVNPSYYCYAVRPLFEALEQVRPNNAKGEYYLTDTLSILIRGGQRVSAITAVPPEDVLSINTRADLALVNRLMRDRVNRGLMESGVTLIDPENTWIDPRAEIGPDTVVEPFVLIEGAVRMGHGCRVPAFSHVRGPTEFAAGETVSAPGVRR